MLTFEKVYEFTSTIGSHTSFEKEECGEYFDLLMELPEKSLIVEVGLEYGRSSSIALQVALERNLIYRGIDIAPKEEWFLKLSELADALGPRFGGRFGMDSKTVLVQFPIAAILIDGDHSYEGVKADCEHFLPHVVKGGYALFHDFRRESLPDVTRAVTEYFHNRLHWMQLPTVGTLAIWRKL
jgi:cephalosporin hydroxylase